MRIALAQINPTVGDVAGNTERIIGFIDRAEADGAELVVFPELAVVGYPPKDLLLRDDLIERSEAATEQIAARCDGIAAIVGYAARNPDPAGRDLHNAAALCHAGGIIDRRVKHLLPTYDVFDESRYFEPGKPTDLTAYRGVALGISICEDLWNERDVVSRQLYHDNPIDHLAERGADLFINCSASPFVVRKHAFRLRLFAHAAKRHHLPVVYVNQVGGNDELIFDGNSCIVDASGDLIAHAKDFEEDLLIADVPLPPIQNRKSKIQNRIETPREGLESVYEALILGLRDYCRKCGFATAVIGLSGGIDSAVTGALAAAALGPESITGVTMPSRYSSPGSRSDAQRLADNLGIAFHTVPIERPHAALEDLLTEAFSHPPGDLTAQNLQARLRGVILMAFSNERGSILLTTGNKSELAVGYCTLYGDMAGGLAVISDLPKNMVYDLARWINTPACPLRRRLGRPPIPDGSITKPPSAELRPDQTDQDTLPPYDELDQIVERYVERNHTPDRIAAETGIDPATAHRVATMIDRSEYKRKQMPPGLKVTGRAFGSGRRVPIAQRYDPRGTAAAAPR